MTLFRCGTVTWKNACTAPAPSTRAARSNPSGTVCNPASIMIIAKGNSFQTLTTINEGNAKVVESRNTMGRSMMCHCKSIPLIRPKSLCSSQRQIYAAGTALMT